MKLSAADLDAYISTHLQRNYPRRLDHSTFWAKVVNVGGAAGSYQVQVQRYGESRPDGGWYPVEAGIVPALGDVGRFQYDDEKVAWMVSHVQATPRVTDMHNYRAKLTYTGSPAVPQGWTFVSFNGIAYDPAGMAASNGSSITVPVAGQYKIAGCLSITQSTAITLAPYLTPPGGSQSQGPLGTFASGGVGTVVSGSWTLPLAAGTNVQLWIFCNAASNIGNGTDRMWMSVDLINAF
jgi:hypothetical protein